MPIDIRFIFYKCTLYLCFVWLYLDRFPKEYFACRFSISKCEMKNICVELCVLHLLQMLSEKEASFKINTPIEYKTLECSLITQTACINTFKRQWGQSRNAINWNHVKPFYMQIQWIPFCSKIYLKCIGDIYRNKYVYV